jgi:hypothetical protein
MSHSNYPTVQEVLDAKDLPDPTVPVPYERFAPLKDSDDMLHHAAFWSFYAAWAAWHADPNTEGDIALQVEARHDGHSFLALAGELHLRDALLVRRDHLEALEASRQAVGGFPGWLTLAILLGIALGMLGHAALVWIGGTL